VTSPLRILLLEDDPTDAALAQELLEADEFVCEVTRVETRAEFLAALESLQNDLILADYKLPSFDGLSALEIVLNSRLDVPFIFVSGTFGEEVAIEALKIGATDYVLKTRLSKLVPAVRRALRERAERKKSEEALRRSEGERRLSEEALKKSERQFRALFDQAAVGIMLLSLSGLTLESNRRMQQMLGYTADELRCRHFEGIAHPDQRDVASNLFAELISGSREYYQIERRYCHKGGALIWADLTVSLVRSDGGEPLFVIAFVEDISDRKRAEEELRQRGRRIHDLELELAHANRVATMGLLTASIAHEINQPITGTVASADAALRWLDTQPPDMKEVRHALDLIMEAGIRAAEVIDRIRALVSKAPPRKDWVDITVAIREVIALTKGEIVKNSVSVQTRLAEGLPFVQGDRVQLQQVLLNLIVNAVEAMSGTSEGQRELLISTEKIESGIAVMVQDSGPGLSPATVGRVFESFHTTKPGGLGLGLSICRSIIEAHRGRLWATNNVRQGATFHFTLPTHS
jgi:PAS domain S-box-containing protein